MDFAAAAENFTAITGASQDLAVQALSMTDGNLEQAVNLFFSGVLGQSEAPALSTPTDLPDIFPLVWGQDAASIPNSWKQQPLDFKGLGLAQKLNGPCGVLAAVQAIALSLTLGGKPTFSEVDEIDDLCLATTITTILSRCRVGGDDEAKIALWKPDTEFRDVELVSVDAQNLLPFVLQSINNFKAPGGIVLLVYSAVYTRGSSVVTTDIAKGMGEPPLVVGPNHLCTSELVNLLVCGVANGNISAYDQGGNKLQSSDNALVGLLSWSELETGLKVADQFKFPEHPVWIIHGGDHFTVAFVGEKTLTPNSKTVFTLFHWNGLPPAGPRMSKLTVDPVKGDANPAPSKHSGGYFKPVPGEIEDIVQAHSDDKAKDSEDYTSWRFEVIRAVDNPDVSGEERPADMPAPKVFDQGDVQPGAWRCASCYATRFKTMCFGQNGDTPTCQHCGKTREESGWSIWVPYSELPEEWQAKMTRRHGARIVSLLRTRWPGCAVKMEDGSSKMASV